MKTRMAVVIGAVWALAAVLLTSLYMMGIAGPAERGERVVTLPPAEAGTSASSGKAGHRVEPSDTPRPAAGGLAGRRMAGGALATAGCDVPTPGGQTPSGQPACDAAWPFAPLPLVIKQPVAYTPMLPGVVSSLPMPLDYIGDVSGLLPPPVQIAQAGDGRNLLAWILGPALLAPIAFRDHDNPGSPIVNPPPPPTDTTSRDTTPQNPPPDTTPQNPPPDTTPQNPPPDTTPQNPPPDSTPQNPPPDGPPPPNGPPPHGPPPNRPPPPPQVVPEPVSMILVGTGLAGIAVGRRRRRKRDEE